MIWPRRYNAHLIYLAMAFMLALTCLWAMHQLEVPETEMERKIASAERLTYYVVTRDGGPAFELSGSERVIKIVTHAILGDADYDPGRVVRYGLQLRLVHRDAVFWQHDAFIDSRQSKDEQIKSDEGQVIWMRENAFTSRLDTELTDDRILLVHLPEELPEGSVLQLALLGEPQEALIVVYQQVERTDAERNRAALLLGEAAAEAMVQRSTYAPWALLAEDEKLRRLSHTFRRMAAMGEPGLDFVTRSVFYTGFRLPLEELTAGGGVIVPPHRAIALNVVGPTDLYFDVRRVSPDAGLRGAAQQLWFPQRLKDELLAVWKRAPTVDPEGILRIVSVSQRETPPTWRLPVPDATGSHHIQVPRGLHSLRVRSTALVRLDISGPPTSQFGAVPYLKYSDARRRLVPDQRSFVVYETGPGLLPIVAGIYVPRDPRDRILRVDTRVVVPEPPDGPVAERTVHFPAEVKVEFLDASGRVIAVQDHAIKPLYTPFERLKRTGDGEPWVTESVGFRMITPEAAQQVRITASRNVVIRLYKFLSGEMVYQPPYRDVAIGRNHWRYAPRNRRHWFHIAPANTAALLRDKQRSTLLAQVRLEPAHGAALSATAGADWTTKAITPLRRPERQQILDPVALERIADVIAAWPVGAMTALIPDQSIQLRFAEPSRSKLYYIVPAQQLGGSVEVQVDGVPVARFRLTATRGFWQLPRIESGDHAVAVVTEADGAMLFVDRPPVLSSARAAASSAAPGAEKTAAKLDDVRIFRRRTVYAMDTAPLEIEVLKPADKPIYVTMVVYAPQVTADDNVKIRAILGGGVPLRITRRLFPQITVAERVIPLPASRQALPALFADLADQEVGYPRFITVPIGADIVAGTHRIDFSSPGLPRLWVRFFVTQPAGPAPDQALQWQITSDPEALPDLVPTEGP